METSQFKYIDERDKAFGITGMVIILTADDNVEYFCEINLDAEAGSNMIMSQSFSLNANPRLCAKTIWSQNIQDLRSSVSMLLANIICRMYIGQNKDLDLNQKKDLRNFVRQQASSYCELDNDEADNVFDSIFNRVNKIFRHRAIPSIAREFSSQLISKRRMSAAESVELLAHLGIR